MSVEQIRQSRVLRRREILFFHQLIEIEVIEYRRRSLQLRLSLSDM